MYAYNSWLCFCYLVVNAQYQDTCLAPPVFTGGDRCVLSHRLKMAAPYVDWLYYLHLGSPVELRPANV
jgi:hypothetical protein